MLTDPRIHQAREHHRKASQVLAEADRHRAQRDDLIRQVREADPSEWSYAHLAEAVGCSRELIAAIVKAAPRKTA